LCKTLNINGIDSNGIGSSGALYRWNDAAQSCDFIGGTDCGNSQAIIGTDGLVACRPIVSPGDPAGMFNSLGAPVSCLNPSVTVQNNKVQITCP
jgi:hypothetical protein